MTLSCSHFSLSTTVHSQQLPSCTVSPYIILHSLSPPISFPLNAPHKCGYINSHGDVGYRISEVLKNRKSSFLWRILSLRCSPFCAVNLPSQLIQWADPPWLSLLFIHNRPDTASHLSFSSSILTSISLTLSLRLLPFFYSLCCTF